MSPLTTHLQRRASLLGAAARSQPILAAACIGGGIALIPTLGYAIRSYNGFIALGPGGVPHNVFGWIFQALFHPFAAGDTIDNGPFRQPRAVRKYGPSSQRSFLDTELPQRRGSRPDVPGYVAPQRQITQQGTAAMITKMDEHLHELAASDSATFVVRPSALEGKHMPAIFLAEPALCHVVMKPTKGETAHLHPEGSSHMVLSLVDAEQAVQKGWAQRHPLSGRLGALPLGYVMVYAPRDEEEFNQWKQLVSASVKFASVNTSAAEQK